MDKPPEGRRTISSIHLTLQGIHMDQGAAQEVPLKLQVSSNEERRGISNKLCNKKDDDANFATRRMMMPSLVLNSDASQAESRNRREGRVPFLTILTFAASYYDFSLQ